MSRLEPEHAQGFTIVELVTVMAVLGILSVGTMTFLNNSSNGYAATISRSQLAEDARLTMARMTSELRRALPRSVRVAGACIEFVPTASASNYVSVPTTMTALSFDSWPLDPLPVAAGLRAAVYPGVGLYQLSNPGPISSTVVLAPPDANNRVRVTLASAHQFASESPQQKYFLVSDPISYCLSAGWLFRYENYGFNSTQPSVVTLPNALPNRSVFAENVIGSFTVSGATLARNSEVVLDLTFQRRDEQVQIAHLVQVRNAP
ncbi:MAG: PulJ/GspJ family protein [Pseudomonadales bacterium]